MIQASFHGNDPERPIGRCRAGGHSKSQGFEVMDVMPPDVLAR
jgi:hypothetical protein